MDSHREGGEASTMARDAPWEKAEKRVNRLVRVAAFMERMGNGLGALAFTWATVVLLGGFSTDMGRDFWYATAIMFLEVFRVFSRESRSDDQLLFKTTGGVTKKKAKLLSDIPYYSNFAIAVVSLNGVAIVVLGTYLPSALRYEMLGLIMFLALSNILGLPASTVKHMKDHFLLQFSPLVPVVAFGFAGVYLSSFPLTHAASAVVPLGCACLLLNLVALMKRSSLSPQLSFPWAKKLASIVHIMTIVCVAMVLNISGTIILFGTLLLGNIQIPVSSARIVLALMRLSSRKDLGRHDSDNQHLVPALKVFYGMVLAQGALYIIACIINSLLSSLPRRSLAWHCNLASDTEGLESVDLYYEHAFDKCMSDGILSPEDLNLIRFALDSLDSNSQHKKLAALRILHSLLRPGASSSNKMVVSKTIASNKAVTTLINMLGWTASSSADKEINTMRLFAAKITAQLADDLRIVGMPGSMQMVSSLIDSQYQQLLSYGSTATSGTETTEQEARSLRPPTQDGSSSSRAADNATETNGLSQQPPTNAASSTSQSQTTGNNSQTASCCCSRITRKFKHFKKLLSLPMQGTENPCKDNDQFPVLGMLIIEKLAHDPGNCAEINTAAGLIPKIIRFLSYAVEIKNISNTHKKLYITSSLKLLKKLVSVEGEIGTALRQQISEQPFLLNSLADILEDGNSSREQWELTMGILANLAADVETSREVGSFQVFIIKLRNVFLDQDAHYDCPLRLVAGEALSNLTTENPDNCLAILGNTGYSLIDMIKTMLQQDEYTYVAATLLRNLCVHSKDKLRCPESSQLLLSTLWEVLTKIVAAEGKNLEALIGLASEICDVTREHLATELETKLQVRTDKLELVNKLVRTLNFNNRPNPSFTRMRRVIVEITISIVKSCPVYATTFKNQNMLQALSNVEGTSSKMESGFPLRDRILRARQLIDPAIPSPGA